MFTREYYAVIHVVGVILLIASLGGTALHAMNGGTSANNQSRRLISIMHGVGAFLILLGGAGLLAALGFMPSERFPAWLAVKITIWILFAAAPFLPYRRPYLARWLMLGLPAFGGLATYMGIYRPF
ncbi:MAG: hypothetical protein IT359_15365 [Gemmatimonadaceae bacterium]|nr:hypothetical protein [Gemmatimonadaceae bacterium]